MVDPSFWPSYQRRRLPATSCWTMPPNARWGLPKCGFGLRERLLSTQAIRWPAIFPALFKALLLTFMFGHIGFSGQNGVLWPEAVLLFIITGAIFFGRETILRRLDLWSRSPFSSQLFVPLVVGLANFLRLVVSRTTVILGYARNVRSSLVECLLWARTCSQFYCQYDVELNR